MSAIAQPKRSAYDRTQFEPTPPAHREPEAPEAASGRVAFVEQEFTHGRSQS